MAKNKTPPPEEQNMNQENLRKRPKRGKSKGAINVGDMIHVRMLHEDVVDYINRMCHETIPGLVISPGAVVRMMVTQTARGIHAPVTPKR